MFNFSYDSANFKASGITHEKNTANTALALLITGCAQRAFAVQNKPAALAPKAHPPIISSFLELGEETVDAAKICGGAENVVKTKRKHS